MAKAVNKKALKPIGKNLRFERKFIYENTYIDDLVNEVLTNSFCFKEIYSRRTVNNIYFDDNNLSYYKQNVSGDDIREKYRIRWYGDDCSAIKNPTFEIKKKFGLVGDKLSYKHKDFETNIKDVQLNDFSKLIYDEKSKNVVSGFFQLNPTLYNSYERRYFLSFCEKFRITLDYNMAFFNPEYEFFLNSEKNIDKHEIILELKYDLPHDQESRAITQQLKSRLSKNSKYVRGVDLIYN